jgi:hypothetical protein
MAMAIYPMQVSQLEGVAEPCSTQEHNVNLPRAANQTLIEVLCCATICMRSTTLVKVDVGAGEISLSLCPWSM